MPNKTILIALENMGTENVQDILTKLEVVSEIYHSETTFSVDDQLVFIYRPLEQWVDAMIRSEIVEIKSNNGIFQRLKLLRKYNKEMRNKQLAFMKDWKVFVSNSMALHSNNKEQSYILRFHNLPTDLNFWLKSDFDLDKSIFENSLTLINKYSDQEIQDIHDYFTNTDIN